MCAPQRTTLQTDVLTKLFQKRKLCRIFTNNISANSPFLNQFGYVVFSQICIHFNIVLIPFQEVRSNFSSLNTFVRSLLRSFIDMSCTHCKCIFVFTHMHGSLNDATLSHTVFSFFNADSRSSFIDIILFALMSRSLMLHAKESKMARGTPNRITRESTSKMTKDSEEELEQDLNETNNVKNGFCARCFARAANCILATEEDNDDSSDSEDELDEPRDYNGLTADEKTRLTIFEINKCREGKNWGDIVDTFLRQLIVEIDRNKSRVSVSESDELVNWKNPANIMAFHIALPKIVYQYYSIAAAHGPLEPTQSTQSNTRSPYTDLVNTDFLKILSSFMNFPKFDFLNINTDVDVSTFHVSFWMAVLVGLLYPCYTIKAFASA